MLSCPPRLLDPAHSRAIRALPADGVATGNSSDTPTYTDPSADETAATTFMIPSSMRRPQRCYRSPHYPNRQWTIMRHSLATHLPEASDEIRTIQAFFRHRDVSSATIYAGVPIPTIAIALAVLSYRLIKLAVGSILVAATSSPQAK